MFRYEIGVLFIPKQFSKITFPVFDTPSFPIPYDLPPVKYQSTGQLMYLGKDHRHPFFAHL